MSISTSLRQAAKLQEKIEGLREQLAGVLDKARSELASSPMEEIPAMPGRRGGPKMLKSVGKKTKGKRAAAVGAPAKRGAKPAKIDGRTMAGRALRGRGMKGAPSAKAAKGAKGARRSPLAGVKRSASPSGPLAPAVVKVLSSKNQPMNVRDILDDLLADGYKFNSSEPKKNLAARIYRLKGVKQVSSGLFATV